jgi:uncharacterized membrane protein
MQVNWKIKSITYAIVRLFVLISFKIRFGVGFIFVTNTWLCIIYAIIFLYDAEKTLMEVYLEKEQNREDKDKWGAVLNNLPLFITIYDKAKRQIKYVNQHFKRTFGVTYCS